MFKLGPREILVGIGSNSADAIAKLRAARARLRAHPRLRLLKCSPLYESDALLPPGAPADWQRPFLNAALLLELKDGTATGPEEAERLLGILKGIEAELGRAPGPRWSPRCIDLDLLDWGGEPVRTEKISVPHQELARRPFALLPAEDCAPLREPSPLAREWRFGREETVPSRTRRASVAWPALVSILNLSPDSFSGDGKGADLEAVEAAARAAIAAGAPILDIGAESTRPGASALGPEEEQARLTPTLTLLGRLKTELGLTLSLDSRHASTVRWALAHFPLDWINDVGGFEDPALLEAAAASSCTLVAMHSLGVPPSAERVLPAAQCPVAQLGQWAESKARALQAAGVSPGRVVLDPGIGFGKTPAQNLALLEGAAALAAGGSSWLIGHSRKRFLDPAQALPAAERDLETAVLTAQLASSGADYLRVHSAAAQARALRLGNRL